MGSLERLVDKISNKIPKETKKDFHYLIHTASTWGLYLSIGLVTAILIGGLIKGCYNKNEENPSVESRQNPAYHSVDNIINP